MNKNETSEEHPQPKNSFWVSNFCLFYFIWLKKIIRTEPIADRHVSCNPQNSIKKHFFNGDFLLMSSQNSCILTLFVVTKSQLKFWFVTNVKWHILQLWLSSSTWLSLVTSSCSSVSCASSLFFFTQVSSFFFLLCSFFPATLLSFSSVRDSNQGSISTKMDKDTKNSKSDQRFRNISQNKNFVFFWTTVKTKMFKNRENLSAYPCNATVYNTHLPSRLSTYYF